MALGMIWLCVLTSCLFALYLIRENRLRDQGKRDYRYEEPEDERNNMGDDCKFCFFFSFLGGVLTPCSCFDPGAGKDAAAGLTRRNLQIRASDLRCEGSPGERWRMRYVRVCLLVVVSQELECSWADRFWSGPSDAGPSAANGAGCESRVPGWNVFQHEPACRSARLSDYIRELDVYIRVHTPLYLRLEASPTPNPLSYYERHLDLR